MKRKFYVRETRIVTNGNTLIQGSDHRAKVIGYYEAETFEEAEAKAKGWMTNRIQEQRAVGFQWVPARSYWQKQISLLPGRNVIATYNLFLCPSCRRCAGNGYTVVNQRASTCRKCNGSGDEENKYLRPLDINRLLTPSLPIANMNVREPIFAGQRESRVQDLASVWG